MTRTIRSTLVLGLLLAGCGARSTNAGPDAAATDGALTDGKPAFSDGARADGAAASEGGARPDGTRPDGALRRDARGDLTALTPCPAQPSAATGACPREGLVCEYGSDPRCLTRATCSKGIWLVLMPKCLPPDPTCPATRAAAAGQSCTKLDAYCNYAGLVCDCSNCIKYPVERCSGPLTWHCEVPSGDTTCPAARPNLGTVCASEGKFCDYGCEDGVSRRCQAGVWVAASRPVGCPISTRRAKQQIHYLNADERAAIAAQAASLRLATYRYRDPALAGRERLGFILEDLPTCHAVDREKQQVDLYAYASMVLALAQEQGQELAKLRRELEALKRQLKARPPGGRPKVH